MFTTKERATRSALQFLRVLKVNAIRYKDGSIKYIDEFKSFESAMRDCFKKKGNLIY